MLMSILAFIKLKNISNDSSTQKEPRNSAPKSGGSFGWKSKQTKTNAKQNIKRSNPTPAGIKYLY